MGFDLADMRRISSDHGQKWFDADTMRYWHTRINESTLTLIKSADVCLFVSSDRIGADGSRLYSVRAFSLTTGSVNTVSRHGTRDSANVALRREAANMRRVTTPVRIQYADETGHVLSGGMYDADDASEATAWADDYNVVTVEKTPRGKWKITSSDGDIKITWYDKRFANIWDALEFIGARTHQAFIDADNTPGTEED